MSDSSSKISNLSSSTSTLKQNVPDETSTYFNTTGKNHNKPSSAQNMTPSANAVIGWFLIALFFCYQYLLRVTPGVISDELRHAFYMTAEEFSSLGAYYLYAYSLLQIPIGFIVDRVGIKRSVLFSIFLCVVGTFWLTETTSLLAAQMSRVLVGAGSACAFMCSLKWVADHFEPGKRGFLMGATLALGTAGALGAGHPLVIGVDAMGWKQAVLATALIGCGLFVFIAFFLKSGRNEKKKMPENDQRNGDGKNSMKAFDLSQFLSDMKAIASNKAIIVYSLLAVGVYTPLAVLADLWGVSFLVEKFHIVRSDAASTTMLMYMGLAVGSLTLPAFSEKYNTFTRSIQVCSLGLLFLFAYMLIADHMSMMLLKAIFFAIGCLCGAEMICFSGALVGAESRTSGLTIGFVNTMNMLGGAILQQIIGFSLDLQWNGAVDSTGIRLYSADQYVLSLMILPVILMGCVVLSLTLKKSDFNTHKKN